MISPTLLIGLGGIGSRIVDEIHGMLNGEEKTHIAVHAFDTDVNDIAGKIRNIGGHVTQTSRSGRVGDYLNATDRSVLEWFPYESPEIKQKNLTDGAGQIRAVSRLAFRAAIENGAMVNLENQIRNLTQARPSVLSSSFRVTIVSSLAGGTGSGIFLQMALYLKDLLEKKYHIPDVMIRGAFVLPDILIKTGVLPMGKGIDNQHDNVRANAYASMKELYGIMFARDSKVTIELEYKPGQRDEVRGHLDVSIPPDIVPYNSLFLYDFENMNGKNLLGYSNYMNQIVWSIYMQLVSPPVANATRSQEDNDILGLIANDGRSRFCSSGIATLSYPYEDIVRYFSARWIGDSLSTQWLKIDEEFIGELKQWERDRMNGIHRPRPEITRRYPDLLAQYAGDDAMPVFFRQVYGTLLRKNEHGEPLRGEYTLDQFLDALETEMRSLTDNEAAANEQAEGFALNERQVKDKDRSKAEIMRFEGELTRLKRKVDSFVGENYLSLANRILYSDNDQPSALSGHDSRLNTWLLKRPEPIHPVGVRSFLYLLDQELERRLQKLEADADNLKKLIDGYERIYDLPETDYVEDAVRRVEDALSQNMIKALWKNKFKEFTDDYCQYSLEQLSFLVEYREVSLKAKTYSAIRNGLSNLIAGWESFFDNLKEIVRKNNDDIWRYGKMHEEIGDPTRQFVLSTKEQKEKLWDGLAAHLAGAEVPPEICARIYVSIYRNFCNSRFREGVAVQKMEPADLIFRRDVVSWCRDAIKEKYGASLDLDIVTALKREHEMAGLPGDPFDHVREKALGLAAVAAPLCQVGHSPMTRCYWGVNAFVFSEVLSGSERNAVFENTGESVSVLDHASFSKNTLVCYKAVYGLLVSDFPKFAAGKMAHTGRPEPAGSYFLTYADRIRKVREQNLVTPHLDKRWHLHAYMPDINSDIAKQEKEKLIRAFFRGLLFGLFKITEQDRMKIWTCSAGGYYDVKVGGKTVTAHYHRLFDALGYNPTVVDRVLDAAAEMEREDIERYSRPSDIARHRFHAAGLESGVVDGLYQMPFEPHAPEDLEDLMFGEILPEFGKVVSDYFTVFYGENKKNSAVQAAESFIGKLWGNCSAQSDPEAGGRYHEGWLLYMKKPVK
jgi:hypothetical protein